jgi:hypothetical protein
MMGATGHRATPIVGERKVESDVGQRAISGPPGDEGQQSLTAGDGALVPSTAELAAERGTVTADVCLSLASFG